MAKYLFAILNRIKKTSILKKLTDNFTIFHVHGNNNGFINEIYKLRIPTILKISMIRNDLVKEKKLPAVTVAEPVISWYVPSKPVI